MSASLQVPDEAIHPLDMVEDLAGSHGWFAERASDDEINMLVEGHWSNLHLALNWRDDFESMHVVCSYDLKVPPGRREEVCRLLSHINEQLLFGHFDIWRQNGTVMFRDSLQLAGGAPFSQAQCEAMIAAALETCERYYPSFQFVIWAGKKAEDALAGALLETQGEA